MAEKKENLYYMAGLAVPETPEPGKDPQPWKDTHVVGKPLPRVDAYHRVSGAAIYPSDVILPDMLYAAMLGSPHANAKVKKVDISEAEKMPGVQAIITGSTPGANIDWRYRGKGKTKLFNPHCRYEGDAVAAVAADSPYHAWSAVQAIKVEYEVLPFVSDPSKALEDDAPKVHEDGNRVGKPEEYSRGDVEKGFSEADVIVEREYESLCQIHTPMELHGCVAQWDGNHLTLWDSTQGVFAVQGEVAKFLAMPLAKVRVIGHYMGGGFGSKLQASKYNICAALLAKKTGRPVKLLLSREQTYLVVGNRPPNVMKVKIGAKKDGALTAIELDAIGTGGAYPAGGVALLDFLFKDNYLCPNVSCKSTDVFINAGPARPFRAPGHPQASWALEQALDELAEGLKMDPVELRIKNVPTYSQSKEGNPPYTTTGLEKCLREAAKAFDWEKKKAAAPESEGHIKTGVGMAGCQWFVGGGWPPSTVIVKLFSDGSANINMGAADLGTGFKTVATLIVREELGLKTDKIQIENADTGTTQFTPPSGGSKTVPSDGEATRFAAVDVKRQILKLAGDDLKVDPSDLNIVGGEVVSKNDPSKKVKITDISGLKKRGMVVGIGYKKPNPENKAINPFGAQFCEVKVNSLTGEIEIVRFVAAHDSGRVMDLLTYNSQVYGGITMGIGFSVTEGRVLDANQTGKLCNKNWHDYKLPTALDVPVDIDSLPLELPDNEANIIGAKGLGEPVTIPTGAAVANAVYNAVGVRLTKTFMTPVQLSQLLAEKAQGKE